MEQHTQDQVDGDNGTDEPGAIVHRRPEPILADFLKELEAYCEAIGSKPSTVCLKVAKNGTLWKRLNNGGDCGTKTVDVLRRYMRDNPPPKEKQACPEKTDQ